MPVNSRLRENPILQRMPTNAREWNHYQNELAKWVIQIAKLGDGTITTSSGTTISGLDEMPGILLSERSMPMVAVGNVISSQDTATPLSASDGGGTATISVAAHALDTATGAINYNSGSVTGLSFSTLYYVYALDAAYAGGAVTYLATTDSSDIVGNTGYYYVGSITTGVVGTSGNISAITKASPTTFTTSSAHGFTTGSTVTIADIVDNGPGGDIESTFNGNAYTCTVTSTTQFTVPVDSSALTNVWASGGTATQTASSPSGTPPSWKDLPL